MSESQYPSTESIMSDLSAESSAAEAKTPEAPQAPEAEAPKSPWDEDEYTIEGGRKIRESRDMILKRAGMGYHYAQQMHALKQEQEKYKGYEEKMAQLARWQEYNDYAEKNPEWARHVEEAWNSRSNLQQSNIAEPINPLVQDLQRQVSELAKFREEVMQAREAEKYQAEDKQFATEIEDTAKKFGVDLQQSDEQGRSLEWRVLEHMKSLGLDGSKPGHFAAAFKDFYFDNLTSRAQEKAKEQTAKKSEELRKQGILEVSRTPKNRSTFNPRQMSWNELSEMALADLQKG